jgi:hypothetical protein
MSSDRPVADLGHREEATMSGQTSDSAVTVASNNPLIDALLWDRRHSGRDSSSER